MPIKTILMVTHNIEEAVLMCDRILVLSSHPGRIASEIKVTFPHPRDRLEPAVPADGRQHLCVDDPPQHVEASPDATGCFPVRASGMVLPRVSTNSIAGLAEEVAAAPYNGKADLPHLADSLSA